MTEYFNDLGLQISYPVPDWTPPPAPPPAVLEGRYCRVEPIDPERHASDLHAANREDREGRIWAYLPYGPFEEEAAYRNWMEQTCMGPDPMFHAIVDVKTGRANGVASYLRIDPANGSIEVGHINYAPSLQRTPAATEAMYLMMKRAFELGYRRYEWKCHALNGKSRAAAMRLGLSYEGVFRQATVVKGHNRDSAWYAAIDSEWPSLKKAFQTWLAPANFDEAGRQMQALSELTGPVLVARG